MADGAFDLARVLFGGGNTTEAYQRGASRAAQLEGLIATAKIKQAEAQAQARLPGALTALGMPSDLATVLQGGYNPEQLSGYQGDVQEQGFRGDAVARALAGDYAGANADLMGVANGPQALASVEGQNLIQNRFLPSGGGISTTDQGAANIRQSDASAASSHAAATASLGRLGIAQQQFDLQRQGVWDPNGHTPGGSAAATAAKASEDERKAAGWYNQAQFALHQMDDAMRQAPDAALPGLIEAFAPSEELANRSMSPQRQRYAQAASSFAEAALRAATGAGINEFEARQKIRELTPQRGDSPEVIQQKRDGMGMYIDSLRARAGRALPPDAMSQTFAGPAPAAAPAHRAVNPQTGQTLVLINGQWVPE